MSSRDGWVVPNMEYIKDIAYGHMTMMWSCVSLLKLVIALPQVIIHLQSVAGATGGAEAIDLEPSAPPIPDPQRAVPSLGVLTC